MTTIKRIANHTGLDPDRVEDILSSVDADPDTLSIDEARIEVIKVLRSGASGTVQKEEVESETARLTQARRIKIEAQTKNIRAAMKHKVVLEGYLIDDLSTPEGRAANAQYDAAYQGLMNLMKCHHEDSKKKPQKPETPERKAATERKPPPAPKAKAGTLNPAVASRSMKTTIIF